MDLPGSSDVTIIGTFTAGEDIALAIDIASGTAPGGLDVSASLIPGRVFGDAFLPTRGATATALGVAPRSASGDIPAGWNVTLAAADSADLAAGTYGAFGRYQDGNTVTIDDVPAVIRINPALPA